MLPRVRSESEPRWSSTSGSARATPGPGAPKPAGCAKPLLGSVEELPPFLLPTGKLAFRWFERLLFYNLKLVKQLARVVSILLESLL